MFDLPPVVPLFPIQACILMPGCNLPLQLFEPRYLQMFEDLDPYQRYIGMVQPKTKLDSSHPDLYTVGTVGEVIEARKLPNRKYAVVLRGIRRFVLEEEIQSDALYRKGKVRYDPYILDPAEDDIDFDKDRFFLLLERYLDQKRIKLKLKNMKDIRNFQIIDILCQALPFTLVEKQALLETKTHEDRKDQLLALLKMETALFGQSSHDDEQFMN